MRSATSLLIILVASFLAGCFAGRNEIFDLKNRYNPSTGDKTVSGIVVDSDEKPVRDAGVFCFQYDSDDFLLALLGLPRVRTREDGVFEVSGLEAGRVDLMVRHPDYKGTILADIPAGSSGIKAVLQPKGEVNIMVEVKDIDSKPLTGVKVLVYDPDESDGPKGEALTDINGTCTIKQPALARDNIGWSLLCDLPGYYYYCRRAFGDMDSHLHITLRKNTKPFRGKVIGADGPVVEGAKVRAFFVSSFPFPKPTLFGGLNYPEKLLTVFTDSNGRFLFPRLSVEDEVTFDVSAVGYARKRFFRNQLTNENAGVLVTLPLACEISGKVFYAETGRPAAGVKVCGGGAQDVTDSKGKYHLQHLEPGAYNVSVNLKGEPPDWTVVAYDSIKVEPNRPLVGNDLALIKGIMVRGRVTDIKTHEPVEAVPMGCHSRARPRSREWVESMETDADGRYVFRLPPGEAYVYVMRTRGTQSKDIVLKEGKIYDRIDFQVNRDEFTKW